MKKILLLFIGLAINLGSIEAQCTGTEPLISQVVEGSSNNKGVEIYNPTGATIDLSNYVLVRYSNGGSGTNLALTGMVGPGDVFTLVNPSAVFTGDVTNGGISHNGNDSYVLQTVGGVVVDSYGDADNSATFGANMNMQRVLGSGACPYDTDPFDAFDPTDYNSTSYSAGIPDGFGVLIGLPVELTSFNVKVIEKNTVLSWTTATELNNSHFDIEYSRDGANFRAIDQVSGNGTTQLKQEYSYTHTSPANGANYYRLKQVDYDGAFEYSDIRVVEIERNGKVVINPSAAIAEITVQLSETTGNNNQIGIYDMMGRTVLMSNFDGSLNTKTLDISNLQKGYYVVRVQAGNQVFTERFMKMVD